MRSKKNHKIENPIKRGKEILKKIILNNINTLPGSMQKIIVEYLDSTITTDSGSQKHAKN